MQKEVRQFFLGSKKRIALTVSGVSLLSVISLGQVVEVLEPEPIVSENGVGIRAMLSNRNAKDRATIKARNGVGIRAMLSNRNAKDRATIKAREVGKLDAKGVYDNGQYGIRVEIRSMREIEDGGVEVIARAWKGARQFGFGYDGSVEWERFKIYNPPLMVRDGTTHTAVHELTGRTYEAPNYKEDPKAAIVESLAHTIMVSGKLGTRIEKGKVGNTTSTFYPDADPESTSVDGFTRRVSVVESWATIRAGAANSSGDTDTARDIAVLTNTSGSPCTDRYEHVARNIFLFDTSALGDSDVINSATFSIYGNNGKQNDYTEAMSVVLTSSSTTSETAINSGDHLIENFGTERFADSDVTESAWSTSAYNDWSMNATGTAAISKTGVTKLGTLTNFDFEDNEPTCGASFISYVNGFHADQTGTTNDPKLVVDHSAGPTVATLVATSTTQTSIEFEGDLLSIGDNTNIFVNHLYGTTVAYGSETSSSTVSATGTYTTTASALTTLVPIHFTAQAIGDTVGAATSTDFVATPGDFSGADQTNDEWTAGTHASTTADGSGNLTLGNFESEVDDEGFEGEGDGDKSFAGGWTNGVGDDCDWQGETTTTASSNTGPSSGAQEGSVFIYTESSSGASNCQTTNDEAHLDYTLSTTTAGSVVFYYSMYGAAMGTLNLQQYDGSTYDTIWTQSGDQGDDWNTQQTVSFDSDTQALRFVGIRGTSFTSDMALDNIQVNEGENATTGTRISLAFDVGAITSVDDSDIAWSATTPASTTVAFATEVNTSSSTPPVSFVSVSNGGTIGGISASDDLSGNYLWVEATLNASSGAALPTIDWVTFAINTGEAAASEGGDGGFFWWW